MTQSVNQDAYETVSWILDNADMGFFIVTAPASMQRKIAELYSSGNTGLYDFSQNKAPYSYYKLIDWLKTQSKKQVFFVLNMQLALKDEKDMLSFNMSRDKLAKEKKIWFFLMTKDLDDRLATFAYDIYSYVRLKAHFIAEDEDNYAGKEIDDYECSLDFNETMTALERHKDLEEKLMALPLNGTSSEQLLSAAILLTNIARHYQDCADYQNSYRLFEKVRDIREMVLGTEHPDTAATYNNIGLTNKYQGDYDQALEFYKKSLLIVERMLGKEHPDTAEVYNNMGLLYKELKDYPNALGFFEKSLAIKVKVLGKEHPSTAATYNNIGLVYQNQGDYTKAMEFLIKALVIREKVLGKEHPFTATTYSNIGSVYKSQRDYTKALSFYEKALAIKGKVQSKEHPSIAAVNNNIAGVYQDQGDYDKALEFYVLAYKVWLRYGAHHPNTVIVYDNMKRAYLESGKEAEDFTDWLQEQLGDNG